MKTQMSFCGNLILSDNTEDNSCNAVHTEEQDDEGNVFNNSSRCHLSLVYPKNAKRWFTNTYTKSGLSIQYLFFLSAIFFFCDILCDTLEFLTIFSKFSQYSLSLSSNIFNFFTSFSFKNVKFHRVITSFGEQTDSLSKPYWTLQFFPQLPAVRRKRNDNVNNKPSKENRWMEEERATTTIHQQALELGFDWMCAN